MARPKKEKKKKEKLSPEERMYRSAVSLMEAVDCVNRFERAVYSLRDAAKKFENLGEYKDSRERYIKCMEEAEKTVSEGSREVFEIAVSKLGDSKSKSDYLDTIEDFKRVKKFDYNVSECEENIALCRKAINRLETAAIWKRRIIAVIIIAVLAAAFINSPLYPLFLKVIQ